MHEVIDNAIIQNKQKIKIKNKKAQFKTAIILDLTGSCFRDVMLVQHNQLRLFSYFLYLI